MIKKTYKKIGRFVFILCLMILQINIANAQGILIYDSDYIQQDNVYTYDADDSGGDITLKFGETLGEYLKWDATDETFSFSDDLNLEGNELKNFRIDNLATAPTCDGTALGRTYYNTTDNNSYICNGTSWDQINGGASGVATGTDYDSWTIDEDDSGTDLSLRFGDTLAEYLQWNDTAQAFILSDDLLLNFHELKQFMVENSATALTCNTTYKGRIYYNTTDNYTYVCNGTSWVRMDESSGNITNHSVGNTDLVSTASATPVTITDLTYTPPAGTWLVTFSATGQGDSTGQDMQYGLFNDAVEIPNTARKLDFNSGAQGDDLWMTLHSQAIITVDGSNTIDARYWTNAGNFYVEDRSLIFVRLGN